MNCSTRKSCRRALFAAVLCFCACAVLIFNRASANFTAQTSLEEATARVQSANDAINRASETVSLTVSVKRETDKAAGRTAANAVTLKILSDLAAYLEIEAEVVHRQMTADKTALDAQTVEIGKLITKFKEPSPEPSDAKTAIALLEAVLPRVVAKNAELTARRDDLKISANKVFKSVSDTAAASAKGFNSLTNLAAVDEEKLKDEKAVKETAPILLKQLTELLPPFDSQMTFHDELIAVWNKLNANLSKFAPEPSVNPQTNLDATAAAIAANVQKIPNWLKLLVADAKAHGNEMLEMRVRLDGNFNEHSINATKMLEAAREKEKNLNAVRDEVQLIASKIEVAADQAAVREILANSDEDLRGTSRSLALLGEGLAGDYDKFVADFVPLYYFTDVFNLMKILNPDAQEIRSVTALREQAEAARRAVDRADLTLADTQAVVNGLQTRVRDMEEELKQAEDNAAASAQAAFLAKRRNDRITDPNDAKKRAAQDAQTDAERRGTEDQNALNELRGEKRNLPVKIAEARNQLLTAQRQAREARSSMILLAQAESTAFTAARDNESVLFAQNLSTTKDPIKQVIIYAFSNRKIIYLRGTRENVNKAKNIIAFFDRPAPQARLTLWTLELNSKATIKGTKKFNESLEIVENQLSNTRTQIAALLSHLRDCINYEVNSIALAKLNQLTRKRRETDSFSSPNSLADAPDEAGDLHWARMFFYQREVLMRLGFDPHETNAVKSRAQSKLIYNLTLPDPAGTTSLGESLVVLAMANPASRHEIMKRFTETVEAELKNVQTPLTDDEDGRERLNEFVLSCKAQKNCFANTQRALGADFEPYSRYQEITEDDLKFGNRPPIQTPPNPQKIPATYAYTPLQRELVKAVSIALVPRLLKRMNQISLRTENKKSACSDAELNDTDRSEQKRLASEIEKVLLFISNAYGVSPTDIVGEAVNAKTAAEKLACEPARFDAARKGLVKISQDMNILRLANGQVAKTDNMLKSLIDALEEDLNRLIVQPMLADLRRRLVKKDIGVGIVNRTSVLATNRLVARVDPRSSAQLSVGEEQDALLAAQQLASLYSAAKTGGLLGGLNGLGGVQSPPDSSEIYGVNSGSVFKVTPVFDPTGQALRFQFDYVLANLVTNPDGSVNPQAPRIERHSVNTEVQLNNLELREISRFEANSKVGIPTTYKGGLPILRDLPVVKKIPLLGWFVRRSGNAAVTQQSLMLGQTTMYPTVADIFDLLSGDDYSFDVF